MLYKDIQIGQLEMARKIVTETFFKHKHLRDSELNGALEAAMSSLYDAIERINHLIEEE